MSQFTALSTVESPLYAAYIGIDWTDHKHDICPYDATTQQVESCIIGSQPEAIEAWVEGLRKRFSQGKVAICTEQKRGPLNLCFVQVRVFGAVSSQHTPGCKLSSSICPFSRKSRPHRCSNSG